MSKYNVGNLVKLRDDLEAEKKYGKDCFVKEMDVMKNNPVKIIDVNESDYLTNYGWYITDEMIEGLWEECKGIAYEPYEEKTNKYKLIDVLNKIANGELKEDYRTEIKMNGLYYRLFACETADNLLTDLFIHLNEEVELIEPPCEDEHIGEADKTIEPTKIEELGFNKLLTIEGNAISIINKLNEVIRYINKE